MYQFFSKIIVVLASTIAAVGHLSWAYAQNFDGGWEGYYVCGGHALKPDLGAFSWQGVNFSVAERPDLCKARFHQ